MSSIVYSFFLFEGKKGRFGELMPFRRYFSTISYEKYGGFCPQISLLGRFPIEKLEILMLFWLEFHVLCRFSIKELKSLRAFGKCIATRRFFNKRIEKSWEFSGCPRLIWRFLVGIKNLGAVGKISMTCVFFCKKQGISGWNFNFRGGFSIKELKKSWEFLGCPRLI